MAATVSLAHRFAVRQDWRSLRVGACTVGAGALVATAAAFGATSQVGDPALVGFVRALLVAAPLTAAYCAWNLRPYEGFARVLLAVGLVSFVTTLADSSDAALYTVGRTAGWALEVLLVYLLVSFPTGRVSERVDRLIVGAAGATGLAFVLPAILAGADLPLPSAYTSCTSACPPNAFAGTGGSAAWVTSSLFGVPRGLAVVAIGVAVLVRVGGRVRAATPLTRWVMMPVLAVGVARVAFDGVVIAVRGVDQAAPIAQTSAWAIAVLTPGIAIAFLAGLTRSRLFAERALLDLAACVQTSPDARTLRRAFAAAFGDPTVDIVFPAGSVEDAWIDFQGHAVPEPHGDSGREVRYVRNGNAVTAAIVCDQGLLAARPELVDAGAALAAVSLENHRLVAEAVASGRELRRSRARIAASAEGERRRIERNLHDGAQQRLVALRIELGLLEDMVERDPAGSVLRVRDLEVAVDEALGDLRSLAHGVYPPLLADRGLADAVTAAASRSPVPAKLDARDVGRYAPEIEGAVYFCVLEALQNVAKHAPTATRVNVALDGGGRGELRFSVHDDGRGAPASGFVGGAGMTNMNDRIVTLGGELRITSAPGIGTKVRGSVPLPARGFSERVSA